MMMMAMVIMMMSSNRADFKRLTGGGGRWAWLDLGRVSLSRRRRRRRRCCRQFINLSLRFMYPFLCVTVNKLLLMAVGGWRSYLPPRLSSPAPPRLAASPALHVTITAYSVQWG